MNKGKPSGPQAETKKDVGIKSSSRARNGQAGAGPAGDHQAAGNAAPGRGAINREQHTAPNLSSDAVKPDTSEKSTRTSSPPVATDEAQHNGKRVVTFEFTNTGATKVCIAGSFNEWHPGATEMVPLGGGRWRKEIKLPPGEYEYRFTVDGEWLPDPNCPVTKPNNFGELNSVLVVS